MMAACFFASFAQAQDKGFDSTPRYLSTQKKYTFAFQPMQWFNWGWRFDFETRLGDGPGWLQFGPTVYMVTKSKKHYYYEDHYWHKSFSDLFYIREPFYKLNGGGLDVNYKRFIDPYRSLYFASGVSYTRFNIDFNGRLGKWNDYTEDGLLYHTYSYSENIHTQHINRMSVNQYFGYQIPSRHAFLFDVFVGISYRHAISDKDKPQFNTYSFSYGHTGFTFMTGVRFGVGIK